MRNVKRGLGNHTGQTSPLLFLALDVSAKHECRPRRSKKDSHRAFSTTSRDGKEASSSDPEDLVPQRDAIDPADNVNSATEGEPRPTTVPFFVGDGHGIGAAIRASDYEHSINHVMIPAATAKALAPEDLEYLQAKHCFALPNLKVCTSLIEAYFRYIHPTFPVIDGPAFLEDYANGGLHRLNLLLLWSMFSVSASYIVDSDLAAVGFSTKMSMKESIVKRAKLLFDLSLENDKIVLLQSALLLSFWFNDSEDVMQSWYWTGIAFSTAQTIGIHRNPNARRKNTSISKKQRHLWRNIWSACVMRDAWLSLGMGRPLRLNKEDSDCPVPTIVDNAAMNEALVLHGKKLWSGSEALALAKVWQSVLTTTDALREILCARYRLRPTSLSSSQIDLLVGTLKDHGGCDDEERTKSRPLAVAGRHLNLHKHAALNALYMAEGSTTKVRAAASATNDILRQFMSDDTIDYAAPTSIPLIYPAIHVHLMDKRSSKPLQRQLSEHNLSLCLMFLSGLQDNYPAAGIIHRLLTTAQTAQSSDMTMDTSTLVVPPVPSLPVDATYLGYASPFSWPSEMSISSDVSVPFNDAPALSFQPPTTS